MNFIGIDLHKKIMAICVVNEQRKVLARKRLRCDDAAGIVAFFKAWQGFQAALEATASYEWFFELLQPLAERIVLANPKKLRVIAESNRKTDKIDAQVLAEFLALDLIPQAFPPTPRQREHRRLVRHRASIRQRLTALANKIRRILSDYNLDRRDLFSAEGLEFLGKASVSAASRFILNDLVEEWHQQNGRLKQVDRALAEFAKQAPVGEVEARQVLKSIPMVGPVTIDVVISELGDVRRFRSQKKAVAYAGLAPGIRESAGKAKQLHISKDGSGLLRCALVEAAWRLVTKQRRWGSQYERLRARMGAKKAIVALARRLLCMMVSMLKRGEAYRLTASPPASA